MSSGSAWVRGHLQQAGHSHQGDPYKKICGVLGSSWLISIEVLFFEVTSEKAR